jgi:hypothetical protein
VLNYLFTVRYRTPKSVEDMACFVLEFCCNVTLRELFVAVAAASMLSMPSDALQAATAQDQQTAASAS